MRCELRQFLDGAVFVVGREKHPAIREVPLPERIERVELSDAARARLAVAGIDRGRAHVAKGEDIGGAALARRSQRVLYSHSVPVTGARPSMPT
jgi:hypothetical protein